MSSSRPIHDPQVLRAIAHPVRNRILGELTAQGPLRAADVARELGIPANQASFHLRQLAKYGLVEEDPEAARDKRDRVWRPTEQAGWDVNFGELAKQPGGKAATDVFRRNAASWGHVVVERVLADDHPEGTSTTLVEQALRLTKDEARALSDEIVALVQGWTERNRGQDPERRTYLFYGALLPHPGLVGEQEAEQADGAGGGVA